MAETPSCSQISMENAKSELAELNDIGVNVWGRPQELLEQQAEQELVVFNKNLNQTRPPEGPLQDNEIKQDNGEDGKCPDKNIGSSLDIAKLIKRQQELKKHQDHKKFLQVSDKSRNIASQFNKKQCQQKNNSAKQSNKSRETKAKRGKYPSRQGKDTEFEKIPEEKDSANECADSGSEYCPSDLSSDSEYLPEVGRKRAKSAKLRKSQDKLERVTDDGNIKCYEERLNAYYKTLEKEHRQSVEEGEELPENEVSIQKRLKCSSRIWNALYGYQQDGVRWLYSTFRKTSGGLLGDEMGLGKTVQVIAFLYSLNYSRLVSNYGGFQGLGATLIVCPSTVIHQWVKHFHDWAPEFRVSILHQSGSYVGNRLSLIKENIQNKGILITTYQSVLKYRAALIAQHWHYLILDEGHKIRNPSAQISEAVKQFRTPYRLLLTGSPMQNNLQELWSLFDFIQPGMLGTLQVFMEHFAAPIVQGGYTTATPMQENLALSMATALKNMITPHLLRRAKSDVSTDIFLPKKNEQVLFCSITPEQRDLYKGFLLSDHVSSLLGRDSKNWFSENHLRANVLMSITALRKICNHPDIYISDAGDDDADLVHQSDTSDMSSGVRNGHFKRSGKMIVVAALLKMWKRQGHRVLLFTQSRAMIAIFERFLRDNHYKFLRMDGATNVASRQPLINKFNEDVSCDVFLLTTRVGGLGINLTGANRVIIYDPDWNPATDTQARERAWRIGQKKEVTIYRLLSAGTIEEKIYQRQIWKQLLSHKVLLDPRTQKFFRSSDLYDLFSLQDHVDTAPETTNIFKNARTVFEEKMKQKSARSSSKRKRSMEPEFDVTFSEEKIEKMKQQAALIAKSLSNMSTSSQTAKVDAVQAEFDEERQEKRRQRELLKKLSPPDLLRHNRDKLLPHEENVGNEVDGRETNVNFTKALIISEKAGQLYKSAKSKPKDGEDAVEAYKLLTQVFDNGPTRSKRQCLPSEDCDSSGRIDGEPIEGLLKRECKVKPREQPEPDAGESGQDSYVLSKLFRRKGLQSAMQHDNMGQGPVLSSSIKIHCETQERLEKAMSALRKSRFVH